MISINTNISALMTQNYMRQTSLRISTSLERLSSGMRINRGSDDPSGLAIASGMSAQLSGIGVAMENVQDALGVLQVADTYLSSVSDLMIRMRDLCLRLANRATMNANPAANPALPALPSDSRIIRNELSMLRDEIERVASSANYNGKQNILFGDFAAGLQYTQAGPNNSANDRINIVLPDLNGMLTSLNAIANPFDPASDANDQVWFDFATSILDDIDEKNPLVPPANQFGLPTLLSARADIGAQELRLQHTLNDLNAEYINVAAARSRIMDTDMAAEFTDLTRNQIIMQASMAMLAQANSAPSIVLQLLNTIPKF